MMIVILLFLIGLFSLCKGGDIFVESAVFFARKFRISEVIIGATILSVGTTLPEITVSALAAAEGSPVISYGNAVGSVICNTALIAGVLCLLAPTAVKRREIGTSAFFLCAAILICFFACLIFGGINAFTGSLLLLVYALSVVYTVTSMKRVRPRQHGVNIQDGMTEPGLKQVLILAAGLIMIIVGSKLLIDNGIRIAEALYVPKHVIAVTLIAFGTSLPELVTAVVSIYKGHAGLSLGNLIGANLLNLTTVIGISGVIAPIQMPFDLIRHDVLFIILPFVLLVLPVLLKKRTFRLQGSALLLLYTYYCIRLFDGSYISAWAPYIPGR